MRGTILFAVTVFVLIKFSFGGIKLVNNGYEGVTILITDRVKEDPNLIHRIKEVFTVASALLFNATKNRAYFKNITIVIPKNWKQVDMYMTVPYVNTFGEHVRVDRTNTSEGTAPYVRGNLECGKPGWYMYLTPDFLTTQGEPSWYRYLTPDFLTTQGDTAYGPHANVIVHEWGHLRWGLFDEFASKQFPGTTLPNQKIEFYNVNGEWKPVTCSRDVTGGAYMDNCNPNKACDLKGHSISIECKFCPDQQQTAKASLMGSQWIRSLDSFCDEDSPFTDLTERHNSEATNAQNEYCDGQSAWEVMRKHPDFKDGNNEEADINTDTVPTFTILKETGRMRVIVYDVSGSMDGEKITQQKLASYVVIDNVINTGSWLGLVSFSTLATTLAAMQKIDDISVRSWLKERVPTFAAGGTNITAGLEEAIKVIEETRFLTNGAEVILLSDGVSSPYVDIIPKLQQKGIIVHTISITQDADVNMTRLAAETGGNSFTFLETQYVTFLDVLSQAISDENTDSQTIEKVFGSKKNISSTRPLVDYFTIDDGLGNATTVTILKSDSYSVSINITGPNGYIYINTSRNDIISINLGDNIPVGKYSITVSTTGNSINVIDVTITTHPVSEEVEVLRVTSSFSSSTLDFNMTNEIQLYASVVKAESPVLKASVTAILAGSMKYTARELSMKDTGTGADLVANDGVYSVYLLKSYFTSNGRYNVKIIVNGDGGTFTYTVNVKTSRASPIPGATKEIEFTPVKLGEFYRQSIPGEITVLNSVANYTDTIPPAKISDLQIESINESNEVMPQALSYTFVWTAVGDNMDVGTASSYEMRMDMDHRHIRHNFTQASTVPVNLTQPKPSGETERYTVKFSLDDCNGTCYLAVRAVDENGLFSDISNIVNVDIYFLNEPEDNDTNLDGLSGVAIIGIAVGAIVISLVLIALASNLIRRRRVRYRA